MPNGKKDESVLDDFSQDFEQKDNQLDQDFPADQSHGLDEALGQAIDNLDQQEITQREPRPNRQHRRASSRLQQELETLREVREASIAENTRLQMLSEQRKFIEGLGGTQIDERLVTLYGNDENGKRAAQITQSLLEDNAKRAREGALEDLRSEQREREKSVREEQTFIDRELEDLEDAHGMDLTSNSPEGRKNRTEFLDMVEKFSPKDADGTISEYADFGQVFDTFNSRKTGNNSRQKDLASRGMVRGGASNQKVGDKGAESYLRDIGII